MEQKFRGARLKDQKKTMKTAKRSHNQFSYLHRVISITTLLTFMFQQVTIHPFSNTEPVVSFAPNAVLAGEPGNFDPLNNQNQPTKDALDWEEARRNGSVLLGREPDKSIHHPTNGNVRHVYTDYDEHGDLWVDYKDGIRKSGDEDPLGERIEVRRASQRGVRRKDLAPFEVDGKMVTKITVYFSGPYAGGEKWRLSERLEEHNNRKNLRKNMVIQKPNGNEVRFNDDFQRARVRPKDAENRDAELADLSMAMDKDGDQEVSVYELLQGIWQAKRMLNTDASSGLYDERYDIYGDNGDWGSDGHFTQDDLDRINDYARDLMSKDPEDPRRFIYDTAMNAISGTMNAMQMMFDGVRVPNMIHESELLTHHNPQYNGEHLSVLGIKRTAEDFLEMLKSDLVTLNAVTSEEVMELNLAVDLEDYTNVRMSQYAHDFRLVDLFMDTAGAIPTLLPVSEMLESFTSLLEHLNILPLSSNGGQEGLAEHLPGLSLDMIGDWNQLRDHYMFNVFQNLQAKPTNDPSTFDLVRMFRNFFHEYKRWLVVDGEVSLERFKKLLKGYPMDIAKFELSNILNIEASEIEVIESSDPEHLHEMGSGGVQLRYGEFDFMVEVSVEEGPMDAELTHVSVPRARSIVGAARHQITSVMGHHDPETWDRILQKQYLLRTSMAEAIDAIELAALSLNEGVAFSMAQVRRFGDELKSYFDEMWMSLRESRHVRNIHNAGGPGIPVHDLIREMEAEVNQAGEPMDGGAPSDWYLALEGVDEADMEGLLLTELDRRNAEQTSMRDVMVSNFTEAIIRNPITVEDNMFPYSSKIELVVRLVEKYGDDIRDASGAINEGRFRDMLRGRDPNHQPESDPRQDVLDAIRDVVADNATNFLTPADDPKYDFNVIKDEMDSENAPNGYVDAGDVSAIINVDTLSEMMFHEVFEQLMWAMKNRMGVENPLYDERLDFDGNEEIDRADLLAAANALRGDRINVTMPTLILNRVLWTKMLEDAHGIGSIEVIYSKEIRDDFPRPLICTADAVDPNCSTLRAETIFYRWTVDDTSFYQVAIGEKQVFMVDGKVAPKLQIPVRVDIDSAFDEDQLMKWAFQAETLEYAKAQLGEEDLDFNQVNVIRLGDDVTPNTPDSEQRMIEAEIMIMSGNSGRAHSLSGIAHRSLVRMAIEDPNHPGDAIVINDWIYGVDYDGLDPEALAMAEARDIVVDELIEMGLDPDDARIELRPKRMTDCPSGPCPLRIFYVEVWITVGGEEMHYVNIIELPAEENEDPAAAMAQALMPLDGGNLGFLKVGHEDNNGPMVPTPNDITPEILEEILIATGTGATIDNIDQDTLRFPNIDGTCDLVRCYRTQIDFLFTIHMDGQDPIPFGGSVMWPGWQRDNYTIEVHQRDENIPLYAKTLMDDMVTTFGFDASDLLDAYDDGELVFTMSNGGITVDLGASLTNTRLKGGKATPLGSLIPSGQIQYFGSFVDLPPVPVKDRNFVISGAYMADVGGPFNYDGVNHPTADLYMFHMNGQLDTSLFYSGGVVLKLVELAYVDARLDGASIRYVPSADITLRQVVFNDTGDVVNVTELANGNDVTYTNEISDDRSEMIRRDANGDIIQIFSLRPEGNRIWADVNTIGARFDHAFVSDDLEGVLDFTRKVESEPRVRDAVNLIRRDLMKSFLQTEAGLDAALINGDIDIHIEISDSGDSFTANVVAPKGLGVDAIVEGSPSLATLMDDRNDLGEITDIAYTAHQLATPGCAIDLNGGLDCPPEPISEYGLQNALFRIDDDVYWMDFNKKRDPNLPPSNAQFGLSLLQSVDVFFDDPNNPVNCIDWPCLPANENKTKNITLERSDDDNLEDITASVMYMNPPTRLRGGDSDENLRYVVDMMNGRIDSITVHDMDNNDAMLETNTFRYCDIPSPNCAPGDLDVVFRDDFEGERTLEMRTFRMANNQPRSQNPPRIGEMDVELVPSGVTRGASFRSWREALLTARDYVTGVVRYSTRIPGFADDNGIAAVTVIDYNLDGDYNDELDLIMVELAAVSYSGAVGEKLTMRPQSAFPRTSSFFVREDGSLERVVQHWNFPAPRGEVVTGVALYDDTSTMTADFASALHSDTTNVRLWNHELNQLTKMILLSDDDSRLNGLADGSEDESMVENFPARWKRTTVYAPGVELPLTDADEEILRVYYTNNEQSHPTDISSWRFSGKDGIMISDGSADISGLLNQANLTPEDVQAIIDERDSTNADRNDWFLGPDAAPFTVSGSNGLENWRYIYYEYSDQLALWDTADPNNVVHLQFPEEMSFDYDRGAGNITPYQVLIPQIQGDADYGVLTLTMPDQPMTATTMMDLHVLGDGVSTIEVTDSNRNGRYDDGDEIVVTIPNAANPDNVVLGTVGAILDTAAPGPGRHSFHVNPTTGAIERVARYLNDDSLLRVSHYGPEGIIADVRRSGAGMLWDYDLNEITNVLYDMTNGLDPFFNDITTFSSAVASEKTINVYSNSDAFPMPDSNSESVTLYFANVPAGHPTFISAFEMASEDGIYIIDQGAPQTWQHILVTGSAVYLASQMGIANIEIAGVMHSWTYSYNPFEKELSIMDANNPITIATMMFPAEVNFHADHDADPTSDNVEVEVAIPQNPNIPDTFGVLSFNLIENMASNLRVELSAVDANLTSDTISVDISNLHAADIVYIDIHERPANPNQAQLLLMMDCSNAPTCVYDAGNRTFKPGMYYDFDIYLNSDEPRDLLISGEFKTQRMAVLPSAPMIDVLGTFGVVVQFDIDRRLPGDEVWIRLDHEGQWVRVDADGQLNGCGVDRFCSIWGGFDAGSTHSFEVMVRDQYGEEVPMERPLDGTFTTRVAPIATADNIDIRFTDVNMGASIRGLQPGDTVTAVLMTGDEAVEELVLECWNGRCAIAGRLQGEMANNQMRPQGINFNGLKFDNEDGYTISIRVTGENDVVVSDEIVLTITPYDLMRAYLRDAIEHFNAYIAELGDAAQDVLDNLADPANFSLPSSATLETKLDELGIPETGRDLWRNLLALASYIYDESLHLKIDGSIPEGLPGIPDLFGSAAAVQAFILGIADHDNDPATAQLFNELWTLTGVNPLEIRPNLITEDNVDNIVRAKGDLGPEYNSSMDYKTGFSDVEMRHEDHDNDPMTPMVTVYYITGNYADANLTAPGPGGLTYSKIIQRQNHLPQIGLDMTDPMLPIPIMLDVMFTGDWVEEISGLDGNFMPTDETSHKVSTTRFIDNELVTLVIDNYAPDFSGAVDGESLAFSTEVRRDGHRPIVGFDPVLNQDILIDAAFEGEWTEVSSGLNHDFLATHKTAYRNYLTRLENNVPVSYVIDNYPTDFSGPITGDDLVFSRMIKRQDHAPIIGIDPWSNDPEFIDHAFIGDWIEIATGLDRAFQGLDSSSYDKRLTRKEDLVPDPNHSLDTNVTYMIRNFSPDYNGVPVGSELSFSRIIKRHGHLPIIGRDPFDPNFPRMLDPALYTGDWMEVVSGLGNQFESTSDTEYNKELNVTWGRDPVTLIVGNYSPDFIGPVAGEELLFTQLVKRNNHLPQIGVDVTDLANPLPIYLAPDSLFRGDWVDETTGLEADFIVGADTAYRKYLDRTVGNSVVTYAIGNYKPDFVGPPFGSESEQLTFSDSILRDAGMNDNPFDIDTMGDLELLSLFAQVYGEIGVVQQTSPEAYYDELEDDTRTDRDNKLAILNHIRGVIESVMSQEPPRGEVRIADVHAEEAGLTPTNAVISATIEGYDNDWVLLEIVDENGNVIFNHSKQCLDNGSCAWDLAQIQGMDILNPNSAYEAVVVVMGTTPNNPILAGPVRQLFKTPRLPIAFGPASWTEDIFAIRNFSMQIDELISDPDRPGLNDTVVLHIESSNADPNFATNRTLALSCDDNGLCTLDSTDQELVSGDLLNIHEDYTFTVEVLDARALVTGMPFPGGQGPSGTFAAADRQRVYLKVARDPSMQFGVDMAQAAANVLGDIAGYDALPTEQELRDHLTALGMDPAAQEIYVRTLALASYIEMESEELESLAPLSKQIPNAFTDVEDLQTFISTLGDPSLARLFFLDYSGEIPVFRGNDGDIDNLDPNQILQVFDSVFPHIGMDPIQFYADRTTDVENDEENKHSILNHVRGMIQGVMAMRAPIAFAPASWTASHYDLKNVEIEVEGLVRDGNNDDLVQIELRSANARPDFSNVIRAVMACDEQGNCRLSSTDVHGEQMDPLADYDMTVQVFDERGIITGVPMATSAPETALAAERQLAYLKAVEVASEDYLREVTDRLRDVVNRTPDLMSDDDLRRDLNPIPFMNQSEKDEIITLRNIYQFLRDAATFPDIDHRSIFDNDPNIDVTNLDIVGQIIDLLMAFGERENYGFEPLLVAVQFEGLDGLDPARDADQIEESYRVTLNGELPMGDPIPTYDTVGINVGDDPEQYYDDQMQLLDGHVRNEENIQNLINGTIFRGLARGRVDQIGDLGYAPEHNRIDNIETSITGMNDQDHVYIIPEHIRDILGVPPAYSTFVPHWDAIFDDDDNIIDGILEGTTGTPGWLETTRISIRYEGGRIVSSSAEVYGLNDRNQFITKGYIDVDYSQVEAHFDGTQVVVTSEGYVHEWHRRANRTTEREVVINFDDLGRRRNSSGTRYLSDGRTVDGFTDMDYSQVLYDDNGNIFSGIVGGTIEVFTTRANRTQESIEFISLNSSGRPSSSYIQTYDLTGVTMTDSYGNNFRMSCDVTIENCTHHELNFGAEVKDEVVYVEVLDQEGNFLNYRRFDIPTQGREAIAFAPASWTASHYAIENYEVQIDNLTLDGINDDLVQIEIRSNDARPEFSSVIHVLMTCEPNGMCSFDSSEAHGQKMDPLADYDLFVQVFDVRGRITGETIAISDPIDLPAIERQYAYLKEVEAAVAPFQANLEAGADLIMNTPAGGRQLITENDLVAAVAMDPSLTPDEILDLERMRTLQEALLNYVSFYSGDSNVIPMPFLDYFGNDAQMDSKADIDAFLARMGAGFIPLEIYEVRPLSGVNDPNLTQTYLDTHAYFGDDIAPALAELERNLPNNLDNYMAILDYMRMRVDELMALPTVVADYQVDLIRTGDMWDVKVYSDYQIEVNLPGVMSDGTPMFKGDVGEILDAHGMAQFDYVSFHVDMFHNLSEVKLYSEDAANPGQYMVEQRLLYQMHDDVLSLSADLSANQATVWDAQLKKKTTFNVDNPADPNWFETETNNTLLSWPIYVDGIKDMVTEVFVADAHFDSGDPGSADVLMTIYHRDGAPDEITTYVFDLKYYIVENGDFDLDRAVWDLSVRTQADMEDMLTDDFNLNGGIGMLSDLDIGQSIAQPVADDNPRDFDSHWVYFERHTGELHYVRANRVCGQFTCNPTILTTLATFDYPEEKVAIVENWPNEFLVDNGVMTVTRTENFKVFGTTGRSMVTQNPNGTYTLLITEPVPLDTPDQERKVYTITGTGFEDLSGGPEGEGFRITGVINPDDSFMTDVVAATLDTGMAYIDEMRSRNWGASSMYSGMVNQKDHREFVSVDGPNELRVADREWMHDGNLIQRQEYAYVPDTAYMTSTTTIRHNPGTPNSPTLDSEMLVLVETYAFAPNGDPIMNIGDIGQMVSGYELGAEFTNGDAADRRSIITDLTDVDIEYDVFKSPIISQIIGNIPEGTPMPHGELIATMVPDDIYIEYGIRHRLDVFGGRRIIVQEDNIGGNFLRMQIQDEDRPYKFNNMMQTDGEASVPAEYGLDHYQIHPNTRYDTFTAYTVDGRHFTIENQVSGAKIVEQEMVDSDNQDGLWKKTTYQLVDSEMVSTWQDHLIVGDVTENLQTIEPDGDGVFTFLDRINANCCAYVLTPNDDGSVTLRSGDLVWVTNPDLGVASINGGSFIYLVYDAAQDKMVYKMLGAATKVQQTWWNHNSNTRSITRWLENDKKPSRWGQRLHDAIEITTTTTASGENHVIELSNPSLQQVLFHRESNNLLLTRDASGMINSVMAAMVEDPMSALMMSSFQLDVATDVDQDEIHLLTFGGEGIQRQAALGGASPAPGRLAIVGDGPGVLSAVYQRRNANGMFENIGSAEMFAIDSYEVTSHPDSRFRHNIPHIQNISMQLTAGGILTLNSGRGETTLEQTLDTSAAGVPVALRTQREFRDGDFRRGPREEVLEIDGTDMLQRTTWSYGPDVITEFVQRYLVTPNESNSAFGNDRLEYTRITDMDGNFRSNEVKVYQGGNMVLNRDLDYEMEELRDPETNLIVSLEAPAGPMYRAFRVDITAEPDREVLRWSQTGTGVHEMYGFDFDPTIGMNRGRVIVESNDGISLELRLEVVAMIDPANPTYVTATDETGVPIDYALTSFDQTGFGNGFSAADVLNVETTSGMFIEFKVWSTSVQYITTEILYSEALGIDLRRETTRRTLAALDNRVVKRYDHLWDSVTNRPKQHHSWDYNGTTGALIRETISRYTENSLGRMDVIRTEDGGHSHYDVKLWDEGMWVIPSVVVHGLSINMETETGLVKYVDSDVVIPESLDMIGFYIDNDVTDYSATNTQRVAALRLMDSNRNGHLEDTEWLPYLAKVQRNLGATDFVDGVRNPDFPHDVNLSLESDSADVQAITSLDMIIFLNVINGVGVPGPGMDSLADYAEWQTVHDAMAGADGVISEDEAILGFANVLNKTLPSDFDTNSDGIFSAAEIALVKVVIDVFVFEPAGHSIEDRGIAMANILALHDANHDGQIDSDFDDLWNNDILPTLGGNSPYDVNGDGVLTGVELVLYANLAMIFWM